MITVTFRGRKRQRAALLQPSSKSCSNEARAAFVGGLEHKVLCQAFCERKRERKWFGVIILGIESSCDETAAAVVEDGRKVLSSVIASQVEEHKLYGGVVPEIASRRHSEAIAGVVRQALADSGKPLSQIDAVAVT